MLITAMFAGCSERERIFSSLALSVGGLNFPQTQESLKLCQKTNDEACLKTYQRVKTAKKSLFSRRRKTALRMAVDSVRDECGKQSADLPTELACEGAIVALYFFPTPQDDLSIRESFDNLPPSSLKKTISSGGRWLTNREDKSAWREWVSRSRLSVEDRHTFIILLDLPPNPELAINHLDETNEF